MVADQPKKHSILKMYESHVLVLPQLIYINTLFPITRLFGIQLGLNGSKEMHHGVKPGKGACRLVARTIWIGCVGALEIREIPLAKFKSGLICSSLVLPLVPCSCKT